jgi:uncharacterized protein
MILEGIVTTLSAQGEVHIAPMGPEIGQEMNRLILKPFQTAQTYKNLMAHPEGVFHVTDDVLLLAQAAIGVIEPRPPVAAAAFVQGSYLTGACRYYEFRIEHSDSTQQRARLEARVLHCGRLRDFLGFNRAKHAVVEAAILATRLHMLPLDEVAREFDRLELLVQKTGGAEERLAFDLLRERLARTMAGRSVLTQPTASSASAEGEI